MFRTALSIDVKVNYRKYERYNKFSHNLLYYLNRLSGAPVIYFITFLEGKVCKTMPNQKSQKNSAVGGLLMIALAVLTALSVLFCCYQLFFGAGSWNPSSCCMMDEVPEERFCPRPRVHGGNQP